MTADTLALTGITEAYEVVPVVSDTPEWKEERRNSIGASEMAAVLSLSPWDTPRSIYMSKLGIDKEFDPVLAFIGHESESLITKWVEQYSSEAGVTLEPAFMARSVAWPWMHASFDRVSHEGGRLMTWQFKTAHQYAGHHWDEGVPDDIRVQVQGEMAVAGTDEARVVVWIGGREFRLFVEPRDDRFIRDYLVPQTHEFWTEHVLARVEPEPTTLHELYEVYPSEADTAIEGSETVMEAAERRAVLLSDIKAQQAEADALSLAIGQYMGTAETLLFEGRKILTYKTQQGRRSVLVADAEREAPHLIRQGNPFKVMRYVKEKSK